MSESLIGPAFEPNSARLEPIDFPLRIPEEDRWWRHLKEPTCVVGEHRQFILPGDFFMFELWDVGDSIAEFFFMISTSNSGSLSGSLLSIIIFGGFWWSAFGSIFLLSQTFYLFTPLTTNYTLSILKFIYYKFILSIKKMFF